VETVNEGSGDNYASLIQMGAAFSGIQASVGRAHWSIVFANELTSE
jgi:hypothetical protein